MASTPPISATSTATRSSCSTRRRPDLGRRRSPTASAAATGLRRPHLLLLGIAVALTSLSGAAHAGCTVSKFGELPVTMSGLRPIVSATINAKPVQLLADSGAFYSMISAGSARELGLSQEPAPEGLQVEGIGGSINVNVAKVDFGISGATIPHVTFLVGGSQIGAAGMLGQNFLGLRDVEYDLPHGAIRLMQPRGCSNANLAYWVKPGDAYSMMPIDGQDMFDRHTTGSVTINGTRFRATFDTGAGDSILSLAAAARIGLKPDMPGAKPGGIQGGIGRKLSASWIVPVDDVKIGDEEIRHARLRIGDAGSGNDMLIGADFFISHRVFVANSQRKMFFSYLGGPVFDLKAHAAGSDGRDAAAAPAAPAADEVKDAEGFSRRGAVRAASHDPDGAIADFSRAIELAPKEQRYLEQRAEVYEDKGQQALAAADIDHALAIAPNDVTARLARAAFRVEADNDEGALADLDVVDRTASPAADQRFEMGDLFSRAGQQDHAIAQMTLWLANHADDSRRPEALANRCWFRALGGAALPQALADCNTALRLRPHVANMLDSRGMVELRLGQFDKAIADYNAALALYPKLPWSLYGRGTAELAEGKTDAGRADIAAALAIDPELPDLAKRYGISSATAPATPPPSRAPSSPG